MSNSESVVVDLFAVLDKHMQESTQDKPRQEDLPQRYIEDIEEQCVQRGTKSSSVSSMYHRYKESEIPTNYNKVIAFLAKLHPDFEEAESVEKRGSKLWTLYRDLIGDKRTTDERTRNETLCWFSALAATGVCPKLAEAFMALWYCNTKQKGNWKEPFPSHMTKFKKQLDQNVEDYPEWNNLIPKFNQYEKEVYRSLQNVTDKEAFRIMRNFALQMDSQDGTFFLSINELSIRLLVPYGTAASLIKRFKQVGIIDLIQRGSSFTKGVSGGRANRYRYMLESDERKAA